MNGLVLFLVCLQTVLTFFLLDMWLTTRAKLSRVSSENDLLRLSLGVKSRR